MHSIRSGSAMAMYLDEVPIYTIIILGRWLSIAFIQYTRKQVQMFSHNVSKRMIKNRHFMHIPSYNPRVSRQDPRLRNNPNNFETRGNYGGV